MFLIHLVVNLYKYHIYIMCDNGCSTCPGNFVPTCNAETTIIVLNFIGNNYYEFKFSDTSYQVLADDAPNLFGLTLTPGNPWKISGQIDPTQIPPPEQPQILVVQFTLTGPGSNKCTVDYGIIFGIPSSAFTGAAIYESGNPNPFHISYGFSGSVTNAPVSGLIFPNGTPNLEILRLPNGFNIDDCNNPNHNPAYFIFPENVSNNGDPRFALAAIYFDSNGQNPIIVANGSTYRASSTGPIGEYNFSIGLAGGTIIYAFKVSQFVFNSPLSAENFKTFIKGVSNSSAISDNNALNGFNMLGDINTIMDNCKLSELPRITLNIEIDNAYQNNSEYQFSVFDTKKYPDGYFCEPMRVCDFIPVYRTDFSKYPQIQKVLKGNVCDGCDPTRGTLYQKINFLIQKFKIQLTFDQFRGQLSFYAGARYVLSGLIYGKFSVKFLLGKFYKKFLNDLFCSRFRTFIVLFIGSIPTNPEIDLSNFDKYFLFDCYDVHKYESRECNKSNNIYGCKKIIPPRKIVRQ